MSRTYFTKAITLKIAFPPNRDPHECPKWFSDENKTKIYYFTEKCHSPRPFLCSFALDLAGHC